MTEYNFSNFLEISVSSIITTIKLNLLEGCVQVLGYWADDWKSHPIKWITPITNQSQTRACQGGRWQVLARWYRGWKVQSLPGVRGWLRRNEGPAHFSIFLPFSGIWDTCHFLLSPLHYHQIIFLKLAHARGSVSFHSAQIFFLTSLCLLGLFSIYWLIFSLWLPTVNTVPTHSIKDFPFFRNGIRLETMQYAPRQLFLFTGQDHTCWTGGIYHTVKHLPTYALRILNNNQKEFVDACIRIQGGRGRGRTDLPYPHSSFTTSLSRTKC